MNISKLSDIILTSNTLLKGMNKTLFLLFFLIFGSDAHSQQFPISDIEVMEGSHILELAMAGGLRSPQFNTMDINLDGLEDIIVFDRDGEVILPLLKKTESGYRFDPTLRSKFPAIRQWMRLVDYNGDGIKDLFCSPISVGIPGVEVYKGIIEDDELRFEQVLFPHNTSDILFYPLGMSRSQVYVSPADQPDVRDIDGDGDIDFLSFEPSGSAVFYYKNMTVERGLDPDLFEVILEDQCFGGFIESGFSKEVSLSPSAGDCASFFRDPDDVVARPRHAGSTVTATDVTGDGLVDVLIGDVSYDGIVQLSNGGNSNLAWMTEQELRFPQASDQAIDFELFLTTFFENVDDDDISELIVASNDISSSQSDNHVWLYDRIVQEGQKDQYLLKTKNFLVDEMIYVGSMSSPMFFDYNNDGLIDLLIGSSGKSPDGISIDPRLVLYENQGSKNVPKYVFVNNDYLGMSEFNTTSRHFAPAIGDMDGDGDQDMVIGDDSGRLYFVENNSGNANILEFGRPVFNPWGIQVSAWAKPAIYDYNQDGMADLVIGEQNFNSLNDKRGSISYFQNHGTVGSPDFNADENVSPNDPVWGGVFMKEDGFISNFSAPVIVNIGDRDVLVAGNEKGTIYLYDSLQKDNGSQFELVSTFWGAIREGNASAIDLADIDDDHFLEIVVGSRRGGIAIYETDLRVDFGSATKEILEDTSISLSPNPATEFIQLKLLERSCRSCLFSITDLQGRVVMARRFEGAKMEVNIGNLIDGMYHINLEGDTFRVTRKFLKIRNSK